MIVDGVIFSIGCFYSATSVAINDTFFFFLLSFPENWFRSMLEQRIFSKEGRCSLGGRKKYNL